MYVDNFANRDKTHTMTARYCTKQNIMCGVDGKLFIANEFIDFACKPKKQSKKTLFAQGLETKAADAKIETKWAGLPYNDGDYVEFNGTLYMIDGIEIDETRETATAFNFMGYNPNTYRTLNLIKALYIGGGIERVEVDK